MPISDSSGRAFEYYVTKAILENLKRDYKIKTKMFPDRAEILFEKEAQKYQGLESSKLTRYTISSKKIADWLSKNRFNDIKSMKFEKTPSIESRGFISSSENQILIGADEITSVELLRISDLAGVRGDVTDTRIYFHSKNGTATINVSLKHRHEALKHPRLTRVPDWIGLGRTEQADEYNLSYKKIWKGFFEKGRSLSPNATKFSDLKTLDINFIEVHLYMPLYSLVAQFLDKNVKNENQAQQLFNFMVGNFNYIKFIDHDNRIDIIDFTDIKNPKSVKIEYPGNRNYLYLHFDNGLSISGRLHTATEWLKESIKFDMQPHNLESIAKIIRLT